MIQVRWWGALVPSFFRKKTKSILRCAGFGKGGGFELGGAGCCRADFLLKKHEIAIDAFGITGRPAARSSVERGGGKDDLSDWGAAWVRAGKIDSTHVADKNWRFDADPVTSFAGAPSAKKPRTLNEGTRDFAPKFRTNGS